MVDRLVPRRPVLSCLLVMFARAFRGAARPAFWRDGRSRSAAASFRTGVARRASYWDDGTRSAPEKSATCASSSTGAPLTEYYSEEAARRGANHVADRWGTILEPYECDRCSLWHLAPAGGGGPRFDDHAVAAFDALDDGRGAFETRDADADAALEALFDREADLEGDPAPWRRACACVGADGAPKRSYDRGEARRQVARGAERGVRLAVYECPTIRGAWHLTKS